MIKTMKKEDTFSIKNINQVTNFPFEDKKKYTNIFIICGAGISTNSGIPDFRSKNSFNTFLKKYKYNNLTFFSEKTAKTNIINSECLKYLRLCYKNKNVIFINKFDIIIYKITYKEFLIDLYFLIYICRISRSLRIELNKINKTEIIINNNYNKHLNKILSSTRSKYLILLSYFILGTYKKPTITHQLMKFLNKESKLKVFTQNIDLLEKYCLPNNNDPKSFYNKNIIINKENIKKKVNNSIIYIHGNLAHLTCNVCLNKIPLTFEVLELWTKGLEKYCNICIENIINKKSIKNIGRFSTNIVNYDSIHPDSEYICKIINDNIKKINQLINKKETIKCLLLIIGTTLSTHSVKSLLNTLLFNIKNLINNSTNNSINCFDSLIVNKTIKKNCKKRFNYFFEGNCDLFSKLFIEKKYGIEKYNTFLKNYNSLILKISKEFEIEKIEEKVKDLLKECYKTLEEEEKKIYIKKQFDLNTSFSELSIHLSPLKQKRKI